MIVSAVILAYNRCAEVIITIQKLTNYSLGLPFDFEIIVVDNASTDNTFEEVRTKFPTITLIKNQKNIGIAGWNEGFKQASGEYFLVLDDDSHIERGLVEAIAFMNDDPEVGILALKIEGGTYQTDEPDEWIDKEECIGFIGCGAIIKRQLYEKIGGYSPWLFLYTHEYEFGLRCMDAGYKIKFFKDSCVIHRTSKLNRTNKRLRTFSTRNELAIVYKYFPEKRSKYLFRIFINNLKLIKTEGLSAGSSVIHGALQFLKMKDKLQYSPVSKEVQSFFTKKYKGTYPIFYRLQKKAALVLR